jgi:quinol monooxygenase YgiN
VPRPRRLRCVVDSRCGDSRRGFAVFEVEWDDAEAMAASLSSPEGQAFATDTGPYVTEGTIFLNYPVQDALSS